MCRYGCQQLSILKPVLNAQNIKLVAIGMDESLDDFIEGHFFSGDVYIDEKMACYKDLQLKKTGLTSMFGLFDPRVTAAYKLAGQVPSNFNHMLTHGTQLGATFVVSEGGSIMFEHRQDHHGDYCDNQKILDVLKLKLPSGTAPTLEPFE